LSRTTGKPDKARQSGRTERRLRDKEIGGKVSDKKAVNVGSGQNRGEGSLEANPEGSNICRGEVIKKKGRKGSKAHMKRQKKTRLRGSTSGRKK